MSIESDIEKLSEQLKAKIAELENMKRKEIIEEEPIEEILREPPQDNIVSSAYLKVTFENDETKEFVIRETESEESGDSDEDLAPEEVHEPAPWLPKDKKISLRPEYTREPKGFVVFAGPNPGVYTSEITAKQRNVNCQVKKYARLEDAHIEWNALNRRQNLLEGNTLASYSEMARSTTNTRISSMQPLAGPSRPKRPIITFAPDVEGNEEEITAPSQSLWLELWNKVRTDQGENLERGFFGQQFGDPREKRMCFVEGADPVMVWRYYNAGLVSNIYVGEDAKEIALFPEGFKKAIRNFRRLMKIEPDRTLYLCVMSSIPDWPSIESEEMGKFYPAYQVIRMGIAHSKEVRRPKDLGAWTYNKEELDSKRAELIDLVYREIQRYGGQRIRINYATKYVLIYSMTSSRELLPPGENHKLMTFEEGFDYYLISLNKASREMWRKILEEREEKREKRQKEKQKQITEYYPQGPKLVTQDTYTEKITGKWGDYA